MFFLHKTGVDKCTVVEEVYYPNDIPRGRKAVRMDDGSLSVAESSDLYKDRGLAVAIFNNDIDSKIRDLDREIWELGKSIRNLNSLRIRS